MTLATDKPDIIEIYMALDGRSIVRPSLGFQKVLCCLHEEREPSASINQSVGRYSCFAGCTDGRAIDSYELVQRKEGIEDFATAQRRAWELAPSSDEVRRQSDGGNRRLAPRKRDRRANRSYVPPWNRGRP